MSNSPANSLDQVRIFNYYMTFAGDIERTAIALSIDPAEIQELANAHNWHRRVKGLAKLPAAGSAESLQVNRTANFAQAQRLRHLVDDVAKELFADEVTTRATLTVPIKGGGFAMSAKPLAELVKSAEAVHAMTYRALGDGTADKKGDGQSDELIKKMSVTIMIGLNHLVEQTAKMKVADQVTDV